MHLPKFSALYARHTDKLYAVAIKINPVEVSCCILKTVRSSCRMLSSKCKFLSYRLNLMSIVAPKISPFV